jgi:uridine monophosphate synthetase
LCKTSNPGAAELQDLHLSPITEEFNSAPNFSVYELLAKRAVKWNKQDNLGLVVGSTQLEALHRIRELAPELWILSPGVGAQGADLETALRVGLREDGLGLIIPVSRGISRQADPRKAANEINSRINKVRKEFKRGEGMEIHQKERVDQTLRPLAIDLLKSGCVKFGIYTLKSGLKSPIYIDLRRLVGLPGLLNRVARSYLPILGGLTFNRLAGLPYAGLPIATAIGLIGDFPLVYPRKESKAYGTQAEIEGIYSPGEQVVLIDDLATTGGSKFEAIEKLHTIGLTVKDVVVLIDRQSGAVEDLANAGYRLHAIFNLTQLLGYWKTAELITEGQVEAVQEFISSTRANPLS